MSRTVRELIRVLERAASQAPLGDLTEVVVSANSADVDDAVAPSSGIYHNGLIGIPGEGETAVGAHFDPDRKLVVIDTQSRI